MWDGPQTYHLAAPPFPHPTQLSHIHIHEAEKALLKAITLLSSLIPPPCFPNPAQLSHIHIHEAEKALLEAIALLATSCICVPLVVSKLPGVHLSVAPPLLLLSPG